MCLLTNDKKVKIATEPITCYKVVQIVANEYIYTPYRGEKISKEHLMGLLPFKAYGKPVIHFNRFFKDDKCNFGLGCSDTFHNNKYRIDKGFIHCFLNKNDALNIKNNCFTQQRRVYEVEIPKGVRYVTGKYGCDSGYNSKANEYETIAAAEIIFKKKEVI